MSEHITLQRAKQHLRILHNHEDDYIKSLIDTALQMVADYIDRPLTDDKCVLPDGTLKAPLIHAALLLLGDLYINREGVSGTTFTVLNINASNLMASYRKMGV
jgi:hypothetical protein